ncbi:glycoside hydrolase family 48 protein [Streptomyces sp. NPDC002851]
MLGLGAAAALTPLAVTLGPAAQKGAAAPNATEYEQRFLDLYGQLTDPANGYFSPDGIPYHAVETLIVEAPDHGHETTSEAYSYLIWLQAMYGKVTGEWDRFNAAWETMEKFMIPSQDQQPTNSFYNAAKPATYAPEWDTPDQYPAQLDAGVPVGSDPLAAELRGAYGTDDIYAMHWLQDVDNTYGYGGDGATPTYINTFQRGPQESVWETVPHPSREEFAHGGPNGFLDLFTGDANYAKQWRFTNAPDADARAVQAAYWAHKWAAAQGKEADVAATVAKAAKMGDYLRYALFDKYFKEIGDCTDPTGCTPGSGKSSAHYLLSWYFAWGGATDTAAGWAWRIGSSHAHGGYQNPLAAHALSGYAPLAPKSASAKADWAASLKRQIEFYRWLQSAEGALAGGATNSWQGHYAEPPAGTPTFYGMAYDEKPVYHDPPSNQWFGFQAWSMERLAAYYKETGDADAKAVLDKWVTWALSETTIADDGTYAIPATLRWSGAPDTWDPSSPGDNTSLHVSVTEHTDDVGVAGAYARTLVQYAAKSGHEAAAATAKALLDGVWAHHRDDKGVAVPEQRDDYKRFQDAVFTPDGWSGTMPNGDTVDASATFASIRSFYTDDPDWPKVRDYLDGGAVPEFTYHRFWAQVDFALAMGTYAELLES